MYVQTFSLPAHLRLSLVTHALALGWGAHLDSLQMQELCSSEDLSLPITSENKGVRLMCQVFVADQGKQPVSSHRQHSNNVTSTSSEELALLHSVKKQPLWELCIASSVNLEASYLLGTQERPRRLAEQNI